jgi:lantibiotic modifying enzyme
MAWRPILEGSAAGEAFAGACAIASSLRDPPDEWAPNASLGRGLAGVALLHAYVWKARGDPADRVAAESLFNRCVEAVATTGMGASLYSGFTGIAWVGVQLQALFGEEEDLNADLDEALLSLLRREEWDADYDLIDGLAGMAVYALERLPRTVARESLERIVTHLERLAVRQDAGLSWFTPAERVVSGERPDGKGYHNLGTARGLPGVLAVLGRASRNGIRTETARRLLEEGARWMASQRVPGARGPSLPPWYAEREPREKTIAGWCYGDPGAAMALLVGSCDAAWDAGQALALDMLRDAAGLSFEEAGLVDAGLCHGAAGLGHIFSRANARFPHPALRAAAITWLLQALELRGEGGIAGYRVWAWPSHWATEAGLQNGASGIGLALLSASRPIEPEWDRVMVCS